MLLIKNIFFLLLLALSIGQVRANDAFMTIPFDVFFAERYKGYVPVRYSEERAEIMLPDAVVKMLPPTKSPEKVKALLSEMGTFERQIEGVGFAVINPEQFTISVRLEKEMLYGVDLNNSFNLANPSKNFALRQRLAATGTHEIKAENSRGAIRHESTFSRGKTRAVAGGVMSSGQKYEITDLYMSRDSDNKVFSAGFLETGGQNFVSSKPYTGVRWEVNNRHIESDVELKASRVEVYVPSASKVEIYRNGTELVYARRHNFGLQAISTRGFPRGSYSIDIIVKEDNGTETTETQMFHKSTSLVERGFPTYKIEAGLLREDVDIDDTPVLYAERRERVTDYMDMKQSIYGTAEAGSLEFALTGLWQLYEFSVSTFATTYGGIGGRSHLYYRGDNMSWRVQGDRVATKTLDDDENQFDHLSTTNAYSSVSGDVQYKIGKATARFSGRYRKYDNADTVYNYGPSLRMSLYQSMKNRVDMAMHYDETNNGRNMGVQVSYRWDDHENNTLISTETGVESQDESHHKQQSVRLHKNFRDANGVGLEADLYNRAESNGGKNVQTALDLDYRNQLLRSRVNAFNQSGSNPKQTVSGEIRTTFAVLGDGTVQPATIPTGEAMIIAEVEGNAKDVPMVVKINNAPRGIVQVGKTLPLSLSTYRNYEVELAAKDKDELLIFNAAPREMSVYPGNIVKEKWHVQKGVIVTGKLVDKSGKALPWAKIKGVTRPALTDENGRFELELTGVESPYVEGDGQCSLALPSPNMNGYLDQLGTVLCL